MSFTGRPVRDAERTAASNEQAHADVKALYIASLAQTEAAATRQRTPASDTSSAVEVVGAVSLPTTPPSGYIVPLTPSPSGPMGRTNATHAPFSPYEESLDPSTPGDLSERSLGGHSSPCLADLDRKQQELDSRMQYLALEQQNMDRERLIAVLSSDLGFQNKCPVAAALVFKCCQQWGAFEEEDSLLCGRICQMIHEQMELHYSDNERLAYWLTTSVALLQPVHEHNSSLLINASTKEDSTQPALMFEQQLFISVQHIYAQIRDNVKIEVFGAGGGNISRPPTPPVGGRRSADSPIHRHLTVEDTCKHIQKVFGTTLQTLQSSHVPSFFIRKVFEQLLSYINEEMFNKMLLSHPCCSLTYGEYLNTGLKGINAWIIETGREWLSENAWELLVHTRQAGAFLTMYHKEKKSLQEIMDAFPALSIHHLYRLSTMYWDDCYGCTETVSPEVEAEMKRLSELDEQLASPNGEVDYLLGDISSAIPFFEKEIVGLFQAEQLLAARMVPKMLSTPSFAFLRED